MRLAIALSALLLLPLVPCAARQESAATGIAVEYAGRAIEPDGVLRDWEGFAPLELRSGNLVRGSDWGGEADLSARVWLSWDEAALYFAANLRDNDFLGCPRGRQLWDCDAFLLSLRFPESERPDDVFYLIATEGGGEPLATGLRGRDGEYSLLPLPAMRLAVRSREGSAPVVEGSVAWADFLGEGCEPPERLDINFEVRDLGADGSLKSIAWVPAESGESARGTPAFALAALMPPSEFEGMVRRGPNVDRVEIVQLVYLPVVVADSNNNYVMDLEIEDFVVLEDGVEQRIDSLRFETRPITVGLLLDCSGSMERHIEQAKLAAVSFLEALREEDRCFVVAFNHNIHLINDMDEGTAEAIETVRNLWAAGGTMLYGTLQYALERMRFLREKKVLVLLSDGVDESQGINPYGYPISFPQILEEARRREVIVYPLAFRLSEAVAVAELRMLAQETGGRMFTAADSDGLLRAYGDIAEELRSQYLLTYVSNNRNWDGRWRSIEVRVRGRDYDVRSRLGYFAPQH